MSARDDFACEEDDLFVALDLETTGFSVHQDDIVQLAATVVQPQPNQSSSSSATAAQSQANQSSSTNSRSVGDQDSSTTFNAYVWPNRDIHPAAAKVTGLTRDVLRSRGAQPLTVVWAAFRRWLLGHKRHATAIDGRAEMSTAIPPGRGRQGRVVLVGHNIVRFDVPFLCNALVRHHVCVDDRTPHTDTTTNQLGPVVVGASRSLFKATSPVAGSAELWRLGVCRIVDTLPWSRHQWPERGIKHTLAAVYERVTGGPLVAAHSADADTRAVARLLLSMTTADRCRFAVPSFAVCPLPLTPLDRTCDRCAIVYSSFFSHVHCSRPPLLVAR